jgi:hypothetical protein
MGRSGGRKRPGYVRKDWDIAFEDFGNRDSIFFHGHGSFLTHGSGNKKVPRQERR